MGPLKVLVDRGCKLGAQPALRKAAPRGMEAQPTPPQQLPLHAPICSAGQYVRIMCPNISNLEWHPFTISSSPGESRACPGSARGRGSRIRVRDPLLFLWLKSRLPPVHRWFSPANPCRS